MAVSHARADHPKIRTTPRERKSNVLTRGDASQVRSIAEAVVIKDGGPLFLCPPDGCPGLEDRHGFGLYHHDTRFLSGYELRVAGSRRSSLAATTPDGS